MLAGIIVASLPLVFMQDAALSPMWKITVGQVTPAIILMVFWAVPLDILMARIYMSERDDALRQRYRRIIRFDLTLMGVMLVGWGPFFLRVVFV